MSAFVCNVKTIAVLADRIVRRFASETGTVDELSAPDFAENMIRLNLKSVGYRYDLTSAKACKEFTSKNMKAYLAEVRELADQDDLMVEYVGRGRLWGAAECFLYQSCEHRDADKDVTYRTVEAFKEVMKQECIRDGIRQEWGEIV